MRGRVIGWMAQDSLHVLFGSHAHNPLGARTPVYLGAATRAPGGDTPFGNGSQYSPLCRTGGNGGDGSQALLPAHKPPIELIVDPDVLPGLDLIEIHGCGGSRRVETFRHEVLFPLLERIR